MSDFVNNWVEQSAYCQTLGMRLASLRDDAAAIALPFIEANANPGNALHGGVAASASVTAAHALARHVLGEETGPWHSMDFQINYLAAAIGEDIQATARLLRRGKELCFMAVDVTGDDGKAIAQCSIAVRGRLGRDGIETPMAAGDHGEVEPGFMGDRIAANPFISGRGIAMDFMRDGQVRLLMPWQDSNGDQGGGMHEGAALALLDTEPCVRGQSRAWASSRPRRHRSRHRSWPRPQRPIWSPMAMSAIAITRCIGMILRSPTPPRAGWSHAARGSIVSLPSD